MKKNKQLEGINYVVYHDQMLDDDVDEKAEILLDKMYRKSQKGLGIGLERKLKDCIQRYPNLPQFKNYLAIYYQRKNKVQKLHAILDETEKMHPDYLFAKTIRAQIAIGEERFEDAAASLGNSYDLRKLFPNKEVFHVSEVSVFHQIWVIYHLEKEELASAEEHLDIIRKYRGVDHPMVKMLESRLLLKQLELGMDRMKNHNELAIIVEAKCTYPFETTTIIPRFHHQEINTLYKSSLESLTEKQIDEIIKLPRATLIQDLELVLKDSVQRWEWFNENQLEWDENLQSFPIHALRFLTALESIDSLDLILNILRQDTELLDYWYADQLNDFFIEVVFKLGANQLPKLYDFATEPYNNTYARLVMTETAAQIILHEPSRRAETIKWFESVLIYHLEHVEKEGIIDTDFFDLMIGDTIVFRGKELMPLIKKVDEKGWLRPFFHGDYENIVIELKKEIDPHLKNPFPENIYEAYSGIYEERRAESNEPIDFQDIEDIRKRNTFLERLGQNEKTVNTLESSSNDWLARPKTSKFEKKIGRNEPCPCGSGKKYKKCCWNT